jgi:hypothetical protein
MVFANFFLKSSLVVHLVFVQTHETFERWKNSFRSIVGDVSSADNGSAIDILLYGYVDSRFLEHVNAKLENYRAFSNLSVCLTEQNRGKSWIINNVVSANPTRETFVFIDSDIVIVNAGTIQTLIELHAVIGCDILVPNQIGDCRHWIDPNYADQRSVELDSRAFIYRTKSSSVQLIDEYAGGIFVSSKNTLLEFPFADVGVYGPDDVLFFKKLLEKSKTISMIENLHVLHPFESDETYIQFKKELFRKKFAKTISEIL